MHGDETIAQLAADLLAWCLSKDGSLLPSLVELSSHSAEEEGWETVRRTMNELLTPPLIAELTRAAEDYYGKDNVVAGGLVRLATRLVDLVHVRNAREATELARNAGCAWMGLAHVLERSDEFKRALDACHLARAFFDVDLAGCAFESARLSIVEAKVQHECGHSAEALEMLDVAASSLLSFGKKKEYIRALTTRASILIDVDRVHEASDVYSEASALASDMGDTKALAYLVSNVGVCHSRLAHYSEAEACLTTAMDMFRSLELWNEIPRARATLARVYLAKGMRQLAFSELYKCRAEFIAAGAPIVAAQVSLWIVEDKFLYEPQSDVVWLCSEMIKTFEVAGLPLQGMKALAYLNESMRQRSGLVNFAAADDSGDVIRRNISFVRQFIDQLEHRPESTFVPPMN